LCDEVTESIRNGLLDDSVVERPEMKTDSFLRMVAQAAPTGIVLGTQGSLPRRGTALVVVCHTSVPLDAASASPQLSCGLT
jgi:hypothetical protein